MRALSIGWLRRAGVGAACAMLALTLAESGVSSRARVGLLAGSHFGSVPSQRSSSAAGLPHLVSGGQDRIVPQSLRGMYPPVALPKAGRVGNGARVGAVAAVPPVASFSAADGVEVAGDRTANSRVYANSDGTQTTELSPAGITVYDGEVATQGGWYMGGTRQTFIPEPWNIPGASVVESWPLVP